MNALQQNHFKSMLAQSRAEDRGTPIQSDGFTANITPSYDAHANLSVPPQQVPLPAAPPTALNSPTEKKETEGQITTWLVLGGGALLLYFLSKK